MENKLFPLKRRDPISCFYKTRKYTSFLINTAFFPFLNLIMFPRCCGSNYMLSNIRIYNSKIRMKTDLTTGLLIRFNSDLITTELVIIASCDCTS